MSTARRSSSLIQLGGSEGKVVTSDPLVKSLPTIDVAHHEIHEGEYFGAGHIWDSVADDGVAEMIVVVGSPNHFHFTPHGALGGDFYVHLYEDPTFADAPTDYGTAVALEDFNRVTDSTPQVTAYHTPTVATDGTLLAAGFIPGGSGNANFAAGGTASGRIERILKTGKIYLLRLTNKAGSTQPASIEIEGYEHE